MSVSTGHRKCSTAHSLTQLIVKFVSLQSLNYELTAGYLNLVVNLICLMILLSRVDDRKVVLGEGFGVVLFLFCYCVVFEI